MSRHRWRHLPSDEQADAWAKAAEDASTRIRSRLPALLATARLAGKDFPANLRRDGGRGGSGAAMVHDHQPGEACSDACGPVSLTTTERLADSLAPAELEADRQLAQDVMATLASVVSLSERMANLRAAPVEVPGLPAGAGECVACGHWCTGSGKRVALTTRLIEGAVDRLRSGYCDPCYRAWLRAGRPDRATFEASRRAFRALMDHRERREAA